MGVFFVHILNIEGLFFTFSAIFGQFMMQEACDTTSGFYNTHDSFRKHSTYNEWGGCVITDET